VLAHAMQVPSPRYFGQFNPTPLPIGVWADALASVLNQNAGAWRNGPTSAMIEARVLRWLCTLIGYGPQSFGVLASGGTEANLIALKCARDRVPAEVGQAFLPVPLQTRGVGVQTRRVSVQTRCVPVETPRVALQTLHSVVQRFLFRVKILIPTCKVPIPTCKLSISAYKILIPTCKVRVPTCKTSVRNGLACYDQLRSAPRPRLCTKSPATRDD
jgi:Pyridoxal-dependent decarboxylase conserved domain